MTEEAPLPPAPPDTGWHPGHNPWVIAVVTTLATFMEVLDTTIVNVSLPHIAGNLGADVNDSTWVLTAYLVSNAIVLPVSAWFASILGRKNYYLLCVAIFTTSSFLCGMAPTLGLLVLFRLLQGVGGGGLQPLSQAILVDTFPARKRGMAMAVFGMTVVAAPVIGPTLGGWITDNFSWRWVFYINIPIGFVAMSLVNKMVQDPPYFRRRHGAALRPDLMGLGLVVLGIGSLQLGLDLGQRKDWFESRLIVALFTLAAVGLIAVVFWELRHKDPAVNIHLLRERNLGFTALTMFVFGFGLYGSTVLLPLFMQTLLGYTALWSGLAISPGALLIMFLMPFVGALTSRVDVRGMITLGIVVLAYSLYRMGCFSLEISFAAVVTARCVQSIGMSFIFVPINTIAYAYVSKENRSSASSLINLARNIGGSVGIAFTSAMIPFRGQIHLNHLVGHMTPYDPVYTERLHAMRDAFMQDLGDPVAATQQSYAVVYNIALRQAHTLAFIDDFRFMAVLMLCIIPLVWAMRRPAESLA